MKIKNDKIFFRILVLGFFLTCFTIFLVKAPSFQVGGYDTFIFLLLVLIIIVFGSLIEYLLVKKNQKNVSKYWKDMAWLLFIFFSMILIAYFSKVDTSILPVSVYYVYKYLKVPKKNISGR